MTLASESSLGTVLARDVRLQDTPVLTVDLDAVDRNIARVQSYCNEHGIACRPHIKTHKLPLIAHQQIAAGAVGITCQKIGEAETMAAAGIRDILITFPIVGEQKLARLARLAREVELSVVGDSEQVVQGISAALAEERAEVGFLVECDTGFGRTGVQTPEAAADLAALSASLPGLRFSGLMTYPTLRESPPFLRAAREAIERRGLKVEIVSGGGTPTALQTHELGEITELRAGTYVYGDRACVANGSVPLSDCALRVAATVVSRPTPGRAIIDAGSKTLTSDPAAGVDDGAFGLIVEYPDAKIYSLHEEHGHVNVADSASQPEVGEIVTIVPNHACGTTNLHDVVLAYRAGRVVGQLPIAARGRIR